MPDPVIEFFHEGSTESTGEQVSSGNPINFGEVAKGSISEVISIDIWNDRAGGAGSDEATEIEFLVIKGTNSASTLLSGTPNNNRQSMVEARSTSAYNVAADAQEEWTPVRDGSHLSIGNMPSNSRRTIELRLNVPTDSDDQPLDGFTPRVQAAAV